MKNYINGTIRAKVLHPVIRMWARRAVPRLSRLLDSTALHIAARKGDADLVQMLMRNGSRLDVQDSSGCTPLEASYAFPEINMAMKMMNDRLSFARIESSKTQQNCYTEWESRFVLGRRISTATPMLHPMWLISLESVLEMYVFFFFTHTHTHTHIYVYRYDKKRARADAHQHLKKKNLLTKWADLPLDARVVFVSHEWVGWRHPDPHGVQLGTLVNRIKFLITSKSSNLVWCDDRLYVFLFFVKRKLVFFFSLTYSIHLHHTFYLHLTFTYRYDRCVDWSILLNRKKCYLWFDWISMPQPAAEPDQNSEAAKIAAAQLSDAVKSIPAYVVIIVLTYAYHITHSLTHFYSHNNNNNYTDT